MRLYRKFLLFVFVYLIQGNDIKIGGPLFVEGYGDAGANRSTPADKTSTPCEKTAEVDIKKYVETTYTRKIEGSVIIYEPQPGYCFNEVKDSGEKIWSTRDQNEYSKKVEADFKTKTVTIYIGSPDGGLTKVFKKGDDDKWAEDAEASTYKGGTGTSDSSGLDCSCGPDCSCGTGCSWSRTWDIIRKYVFCGCCGCCGSENECGWCGLCELCRSRGLSGRKTGVDLDITKTKSGLFNREFDHARDGNYTTYTAKGSNAFKLVKEGDTEIWKTSDESEYSPRVELDNLSPDSRSITIYLPENMTKVFIKLGRDDPWAEIDTTKVTTKPINIGYAYNSYFSALRTQGNVRIFTARRGFAFNGANVYLDDKKKVEIWKTDQESEYANKIVNIGGTKVEIHLVNGPGKVFTKVSHTKWQEEAYEPQPISPDSQEESSSGWSGTWNKITGWFGSCGSSCSWDAIKGWLCCSSCGSCGSSESSTETPAGNENEKTATVDIKKQMATDYMSKMDGYKLTYKPRGEVSFNAVKEDSKEIWKTDKSDEYSKKVVADFAKNIVTIYIGSGEGSTKVFTKGSDGTWKEDTNKSTHKSTTNGSGTTGSGGGTTPSSQPSGGTGQGTGTTGTGASGG